MVKACVLSAFSLAAGVQFTDQKAACWSKVSRRTGLVLSQNPGAGLGKIEPFDKVLKDGFFKVDCIKDSMYYHGDKFGGNKHDYKLADTQNVSIVHYNDHVAKEDREPITPTVCFNFCRTIPDMGYFGILNGRECYCEPHYDAMASDSSGCDSVCDGDNGQMCGGKTKSNVWGMHACNDGAQVLGKAAWEANEVTTALDKLVKDATTAANGKQDLAASLQKDFSKAGDPDAGKLMQAAKVSAGELLHEAEDAGEVSKGLAKVVDTASKLAGVASLKGPVDKLAFDKSKAEAFTKSDVAIKGDELVKELTDLTPKAKETSASLAKTYEHNKPFKAEKGEDDDGLQYYPAMYFIDKEFVDVPMTCSGPSVGEPLYAKNYDGCAAACDAHNEECVGFSYFPNKKDESNLCFLYSGFKTGQYYTGCAPAKKVPSFLQKTNVTAPIKGEPTTPVCVAKLAKFSGTTLKPDPEGKCKQCLRELTKANRCYK